MTRAPLKSAAARAGGEPITIPMILVRYGPDGGHVEMEATFYFSPILGAKLTEQIGDLQDYIRQNADEDGGISFGSQQVEYLLNILEGAAVADTAQRLRDHVERNELGVADLSELVQAFVEEASGTHPTKRSPSADGSEQTGGPSTDGAPNTESMPPPSPSIAS